jgi:O-antigen/teichoic acid export membrane protein
MKIVFHLLFENDTKYVLWSQLVTIFFQLFLVFFIGRHFSLEELGNYGIISAIVNPLQVLTYMGIGQILIADDFYNDRQRVYNSIIWFSVAVMIFLSVVFWVFVYSKNGITGIFLFALYKGTLNLQNYYHAVYQRSDSLGNLGRSRLISSFLGLLVFIPIASFSKSWINGLGAVSVVNLIVLFTFDKKNIINLGYENYSRFSVKRSDIAEVLALSMPLGLSSIVVSLKSNLPRYLIEYFIGSRSVLGLYTGAAQFVAVVGVVNQTVIKIIIGKLKKTLSANRELYKVRLMSFVRRSFYVMVVVNFVVLLIYVITIEILNDITLKKQGLLIGIGLLIARIFTVPTAYLKLHQVFVSRTSYQFRLGVGVFLLHLLFGYLLTIHFGIVGLLTSVVFTEVVLFLLTYKDVKLFFQK